MRVSPWTRLLAPLLILNLIAPGPSLAADDPLTLLRTLPGRGTSQDLTQPAAVASITLPSNLARYGVVETDYYQVHAEPGPIEVGVTADPEAQGAHVILYQLSTEAILIDHFFDGRMTESQSATITTAGDYGLIIIENRLAAVQLHGEALVVATMLPAIALPIAPYATWNTPAPAQAEVRNPAFTASLELYLGTELLDDELLQPDGSVKPITVSTTDLADGIYTITLVASAKESANASYLFRPILVDRAPAFADVSFDHWAHQPVEVMFHSGVVNGREPGRFEPEAPVLREEFAKMLAVTLNLDVDRPRGNPFVDLPNDYWATPYILALYEAGLARGEIEDGRLYFHPERTINRAEAATIIGRVLGVDEGSYKTPIWWDWSDVPEWARPSVANLAQAGWLNGFPDGRYLPGGELLRSQAAKILAKFLGL